MAKEKNAEKEILLWIKAVVIVIILALALRTFVFRICIIKGTSMVPSYYHGDVVFMDKLTYLFSSPEEGDAVICANAMGLSEGNLAKRVIGTPGDTISLEFNGEKVILIINGEEVEEDYIAEEMQQAGDVDYPITIPEGYYFIMGDNRNMSTDSRYKSVGLISEESIQGKIVFTVWPLFK